MARPVPGRPPRPSSAHFPTAAPNDPRVPLALAGIVVAVAFAATLIRLAEPLDAMVIATLRVAFTAAAWLALGGRSAVRALRAAPLGRRTWVACVLGAAAMAGHFGLWTAAVVHTSVARATLLVSTAPLFAGILGRLLGDRCPARFWIGATVALGGTALLALDTGDGAIVGALGAGDAFALGAAACAAVYLAVGRGVRRALPLTGYLALLHGLSATLLAGATLAAGRPWHPAGAAPSDYAAVVALAAVAGVVGHGLQNWSVRHVPVHVVTTALLLEPLAAGALAWVVLGERVGARDVVGGAILLGGVALALQRSR